MSDKSGKLKDLMALVKPGWTPPHGVEAANLLEHGMLAVMSRHLSDQQCDKTLRALKAAYSDWNELRVSQVHEFLDRVQTKNVELQKRVANDLREYLQEIFQKNHGFDLEFLRTDPVAAGKFVQDHPFLGGSAAHYLLWVANPEEPPVSPSTGRVLDRLGVLKRSPSIKKAQEALAGFLPKDLYPTFALTLGLVAETWCDAKKPVCWECALVRSCPFGTKVEKEWKAQQRRLEAQRKKDEERRRKEEEKERKRAAAEARKKAKELVRVQARREKEKAREETRRKREAEKVERQRASAAKAKAAAALARKKAAKQAKTKKKAGAAKKTARKATPRKTSGGKKPASRPATRKKASPARSTASRKSASKTSRKTRTGGTRSR